MRDPYDVLGVDKSATQDEIKRAFRRLASRHHPDRGGDEVVFKEINSAYQVLSGVAGGHVSTHEDVDAFIRAVQEVFRAQGAVRARRSRFDGEPFFTGQSIKGEPVRHHREVREVSRGRVVFQTAPHDDYIDGVRASVVTMRDRGFKVMTPLLVKKVGYDKGVVRSWCLYNPRNEWEEYVPADQVVAIRVRSDHWVDGLIVTLAWARRIGLTQFVEGEVVDVERQE